MFILFVNSAGFVSFSELVLTECYGFNLYSKYKYILIINNTYNKILLTYFLDRFC